MDLKIPDLIGLTEKWGNEHWSAAVQKANIALLRDALKVADNEIRRLEIRAKNAEEELRIARDAVNQEADEMRRLKKFQSPEIMLNDHESTVLKAVAYLSDGDGFSNTIEIQNYTGISAARIALSVGRLVDRGMLKTVGPSVRMQQPGLEYLASVGHI
jgi:helix-turn-helix protein